MGCNILYRCFKTENNIDDAGKEKGVGLQMSIHLLHTESKNMGFTYQNPFFHFYWHSPTVYEKYYTRVDQFPR